MARAHKKKASTNLLISVDDESMDRVHDVTEELKAAGLKVDQVMEKLGTITGSAAPSTVAALKRVKGVAGIEESLTARIAPPESEVQ